MSGGRAAYGAVLSTTRAPRPAARRTAAHTASRSTSSWSEEHVARAEGIDCRDLEITHVVVGSGDDDDRVLAAVGHRDDRRSGGHPRAHAHPGDVHAQGLEPAPVGSTAGVVADAAHHGHRRARRCRSHGLVGPLATGQLLQALTGHGLPRPRMPFHPRHEVDVERPEHEHPPTHDASPRTVRTHSSAIRGPSIDRQTST